MRIIIYVALILATLFGVVWFHEIMYETYGWTIDLIEAVQTGYRFAFPLFCTYLIIIVGVIATCIYWASGVK